MDLETLIVAAFCVVDDFVRDLCPGRGLRQRGPTPVLADSEVLTVEIVGEFLGLDTDQGLHAYFRRHFGHLFPRLREWVWVWVCPGSVDGWGTCVTTGSWLRRVRAPVHR